MPGGGWGYKQQTNDGNLFVPPGLLLSVDERSSRLSAAQGKREEGYKDAGIKYREKHEGPLKGKTNVVGYTQGKTRRSSFRAMEISLACLQRGSQ
jgi:hypothetical protein